MLFLWYEESPCWWIIVELKLDEVRVRVSSWSCKLLVQVMFIACFILVFAYLLIYWSLLCCLWCFEKLGVSSKWPKVRVLSKMQDLDQLMLNLRCVFMWLEKEFYLIWIWRGIMYGVFVWGWDVPKCVYILLRKSLSWGLV